MWSRDPSVLDPGLSGEIPTSLLGNESYTKYQRPQRLGNLGCLLRVDVDMCDAAQEKEWEARSLLTLSKYFWDYVGHQDFESSVTSLGTFTS